MRENIAMKCDKGRGVQNCTPKGGTIGGFPSETLRQIYILYHIRGYTPKEVSIERKTTIWAVYKSLKKLRKLGYLGVGYNKGEYQGGRGVQKPENIVPKIRLHSIMLNVKIIKKSKRYLLQKGLPDRLDFDNNTILLYDNSIMIYDLKSYWSDSAKESIGQALRVHKTLLRKLQSKLGVLLLQDGIQNIKWAKSHVSDTDNALAKDQIYKNQRLYVRDKEGVLKLLIDNSENLYELEAVDTKTNVSDMDDKITPFFQGLLSMKSEFNPQQILNFIGALSQSQVNMLQTLTKVDKTLDLLKTIFSIEQDNINPLSF